MRVSDRLADRITTLAARMLERREPDWARAMRAEIDVIPAGRRRLTAAAGMLLAAVRLSTPRPVTVLLAVASAGAVALCDRAASDDSQLTMLVLLAGSAVLGARAGRAWPVPAVLIGSVVAISHLVLVARGDPAPYQQHPPGQTGALSLFVLIVPAAMAALAGSKLAVHRRHPESGGP